MLHLFAGESRSSGRRRGNRPKSLRQKNREREKDTLESRGKPRAEGVSAADRVPVARVSQASDRGARTCRDCGWMRATPEALWARLKQPIKLFH